MQNGTEGSETNNLPATGRLSDWLRCLAGASCTGTLLFYTALLPRPLSSVPTDPIASRQAGLAALVHQRAVFCTLHDWRLTGVGLGTTYETDPKR